MTVSAVIPTRGDVDLLPVLESLPPEWEKVVYIGGERVDVYNGFGGLHHVFGVPDLGPHGRFAAIEYATHDLIYVQDDDVIMSDPAAIVRALVTRECPECGRLDHQSMTDGSWICHSCGCVEALPDAVVCNMPQEFRTHYPDSAMVGFGAAFHRDAPARAFARMDAYVEAEVAAGRDCCAYPMFYRESCRIFTVLTPRVLVDVPKIDREMASDPNRLWKQPDHLESRDAALRLARAVRDA